MDLNLAAAIVSTSAFTALLTLSLNRLLDWHRRNTQAKGYLRGIQLEIAYAQECADAYLTKSTRAIPYGSQGTGLQLNSLACAMVDCGGVPEG